MTHSDDDRHRDLLGLEQHPLKREPFGVLLHEERLAVVLTGDQYAAHIGVLEVRRARQIALKELARLGGPRDVPEDLRDARGGAFGGGQEGEGDLAGLQVTLDFIPPKPLRVRWFSVRRHLEKSYQGSTRLAREPTTWPSAPGARDHATADPAGRSSRRGRPNAQNSRDPSRGKNNSWARLRTKTGYSRWVPHEDPPIDSLSLPSDRASTYPVSRLAPRFDLVNIALEIQEADRVLGAVVGGQMDLIADQIHQLQAKAKALLERAKEDAELHRADCHFKKVPGRAYHLYARSPGDRYFSMLSPEDWGHRPPHGFVGTYRLEADLSFTRLDVG